MGLLRWHTESHPVVLCGRLLTPENWVGGVVLQYGRWRNLHSYHKWQKGDPPASGRDANGSYWFCPSRGDHHWIHEDEYVPGKSTCSTLSADLKGVYPIFPPKGFGGCSDEELWDAVFGKVERAPVDDAGESPQVFIVRGMGVSLALTDWPAERIPHLSQSIESARVLTVRLGLHKLTAKAAQAA